MTVPKTAKYLRVAPLTLYRWIKKYPDFPATRGQPFNPLAWNIDKTKRDEWLEKKNKLDIPSYKREEIPE